MNTLNCVLCLLRTPPAYGATLIEHSLIEVGLPGSVKVDGQVDAGIVEEIKMIVLWLIQRRVADEVLFCDNMFYLLFLVAPKILEALQIAETYMEKTQNFSGKVRDL